MFFPLHDNNPTTRTPVVTISLIVVNTAAFIWLARLPEPRQQDAVIHYGFIPARIAQLSDPRLIVQAPIQQAVKNPVNGQLVLIPKKVPLAPDPAQIYTSLVTTMFLHGGWMHLIGNMWFLWLFGNNIEDRLGHVLFGLFYLIGGFLASACHYAYNPASLTPVIGASGAVSALLGAYAITYPHAKVKTFVFLIIYFTVIEFPAWVVLGVWFVLQLAEAAQLLRVPMQGGIRVAAAEGVAWWAHVGGFVAGLILMPLLSAGTPPPGTNWKQEAEEAFK